MSLWNLDLRQAGVTEPDAFCVKALTGWRCYREGEGEEDLAVLLGDGPTEAAALRAARRAAGLGHVAEQPCARFVGCRHDNAPCAFEDLCSSCAWPEDRHGKGERS